ncbi:MAG: single-stranded-DNA-specific exonuclease RecJ, partial [Candidatus Cloacimonadota bacterium]
MQKRWQIHEPLIEEQLAQKNAIIEKIKCPDMIAEMLIRKGLTELDEINSFFHPDLQNVHDPFIFKDMKVAVERIIRAIKDQELITIYGDYDVDGTTSTSLLYLGLRKIGAIVDFYIPHRMIDGYGLSLSGVDQIIDKGSKLIISVDCGINAIEEVQQINEQGIDIIVTDHHNPKEVLPDAYAIINPKMEDSNYPFKDLAGVGVAYKLLVAVYTSMDMDTTSLIDKYVDLVALGTIAD